MKITTILFDMDGTLLDTIDDIADSLNKTLKDYGFPTRTVSEVKSFVGNGAKTLAIRALPPNLEEAVLNEFLLSYQKNYLDNLQNQTKPYDNIISLLEKLKSKGYKLAIISNKPHDGVTSLCKEYFHNFITLAFGESEDTLKKPAPDGIYKALDELNSRKEEAVYVGDSEVDVITAKNAGLISVGVTWGFRSKEILQNEGCDYIIDSPLDLLTLLQNL